MAAVTNITTTDADVQPLVLVADDEPYAQMLLQRILEREGYRVETANDGRIAIEKAQTLNPELILMDIQMPDINGFEAVGLLRNDTRTSRIPIIVVTAAAREPGDVAKGFGLGADDYLRKPFNTSELVARVASKIRAHQLEEGLQQRTAELEALIRIGSELNQQLELGELADRILSAVRAQIPSDSAVLVLVNAEQKSTLTRMQGAKDDHLLEPKTLPGYVLKNGEAALVREIDNDPNLTAILDGESYVSGIATPLRHGGQILGVLALGDKQAGYFSPEHLRVLRSIAEQAALAIRNAQLYTELRGYAQGLESMVEARTAALKSAQEQLLRAEKMAALGTLAAGVAHEVNNPLQPILTNLELALEDIDDKRPVDRELLDFAKRDVQRIQRIVSNLLDFARPRPASFEAVNVDQIIGEVLTLAGKQLEHAKVKVKTTLATKNPIQGNADQLKQVFLNLVVNAMEAMPEGGQLNIRTTEKSGTITLKVRDSGVGVPPEDLPRLFDPFFTTKADGTGLGLSVSYGIIQSHSGEIEAASKPGEYTEFTIRLPVATEKAPAPDKT